MVGIFAANETSDKLIKLGRRSGKSKVVFSFHGQLSEICTM